MEMSRRMLRERAQNILRYPRCGSLKSRDLCDGMRMRRGGRMEVQLVVGTLEELLLCWAVPEQWAFRLPAEPHCAHCARWVEALHKTPPRTCIVIR